MSEETPLPHPPLSIVEARALGCLMEKEVTTPDNYPLSLNALVNACNQKSNRFPVMELTEENLDSAIENLRSKRLALRVSQADARVAKFKHSLENVYPISPGQKAILAELLIRGPQTAGELRTRCERMLRFEDLASLRQALDAMSQCDFPIVLELPRQPGKKDPRFAHLLSGTPDFETTDAPATKTPMTVEMAVSLPPEAEERLAALEALVAEQGMIIQALRTELNEFRSQFD